MKPKQTQVIEVQLSPILPALRRLTDKQSTKKGTTEEIMLRPNAYIVGPAGGSSDGQGISKPAVLVITETGEKKDLAILPGTTPEDIIRQFHLPDGTIITPGGGNAPFGPDENIYTRIIAGTELYATTQVTAGGLLDSILRGPLFGGALPPKITPRPLPVPRPVLRRPEGLKIPQHTPNRSVQQMPAQVQKSAWPESQQRIVVQRAEKPYWEQQHWQKQGRNYYGYYRTRGGSFKGSIEVSSSGAHDIRIKDPPEGLKSHPCVHRKGKGWYYIHFHEERENVDAYILEVETMIVERMV